MLSVNHSNLTLYISEVSQLYWTIIRQTRLYIDNIFPSLLYILTINLYLNTALHPNRVKILLHVFFFFFFLNLRNFSSSLIYTGSPFKAGPTAETQHLRL